VLPETLGAIPNIRDIPDILDYIPEILHTILNITGGYL
jgi:hypothetical protein